MTLETIYYIGQTIAVAAILASLLAIYFQQRQTNRIARAENTEKVSSNYSDSLREIMVNSELAEIFRKVMFEKTDLTPVEATRILIYFSLTLQSHRNAFFAFRDGLIDQRHLTDADSNTSWYLTAPLFAREWKRLLRKGQFGQDFAKHVAEQFVVRYPDHEGLALTENEDSQP